MADWMYALALAVRAFRSIVLVALIGVAAVVLVTVASSPEASADRAPLPSEKTFDAGDKYGKVRRFCDGPIMVYLTDDKSYSSPQIAVVPHRECK